MEKLLSKQQKTKGGNYEFSLTCQRTKIVALAAKATQLFLANTRQPIKNQPYSGCIILVNQ